jgi:hypothetical protein
MTVSPQRAEEVLARFRQQKPEAVRLAELVCLATRIEHGLLREARLRLAPDTDAGAEADLWFSPLTESWSARAFVLSPSVAASLQAELLKDRERAKRAWALTERLHSNVPPIIAVEERVTWLALSQGAKALPEVERELQAVLRTMLHDESQGPGVARWALRAIPRLPTLARETGTARLLAFGAAARLGIRTLADGAVPLPPQDASWLLPQSSSEPLLEIRVVRTTGGLTFFHGLTKAEGHPLLIPNTRPLLLDVAWVQEGQEQHRLIEARIGATLPIPADVRAIRLRTVAGDEYELSAESSSNAPPLPRYLDDTVWQSLAWIPGRPQPTTAYFIDSSALLTAATAFLDEPAESPVEIVWNEKRFTATLLHTDVRAGYALLELPEGSPRANPLAGTIPMSTEESALGHKRDWVAYGLLEGERLWIEGYLDQVLLSVEEEVYATRASLPFDRLPIGSPIFMDGLFLVGHVDWWEGQTIHFGTAPGVHETLSELREARARRRPTSSNVPPAEISHEESPPIEGAASQDAELLSEAEEERFDFNQARLEEMKALILNDGSVDPLIRSQIPERLEGQAITSSRFPSMNRKALISSVGEISRLTVNLRSMALDSYNTVTLDASVELQKATLVLDLRSPDPSSWTQEEADRFIFRPEGWSADRDEVEAIVSLQALARVEIETETPEDNSERVSTVYVSYIEDIEVVAVHPQPGPRRSVRAPIQKKPSRKSSKRNSKLGPRRSRKPRSPKQ